MKNIVKSLMLGGLTLAMVSGPVLGVKAETINYTSDPTSVVNDSGASLYILPMGAGATNNKILGGSYTIRQIEAITETGEFVPVNGPTQMVNIDGVNPETGEHMDYPSIVNFSGEGVYEYYNSGRVPGYYLDTQVYTIGVPSSTQYDFTGTQAEYYAQAKGVNLDEYIPGMSGAHPNSVFTLPKLNLVKGDIMFTKTDSNGEPLEGAQFQLEQILDARVLPDSELIVRELVTAADGIVLFTDLPEGTYRITELTAPESYAQSMTPQIFNITVDETGLQSVVEEATAAEDDLINEDSQFINYKAPEFTPQFSTTYGERPIYSANERIGLYYQIDLPENIEDYELFNIKATLPDEFKLTDIDEAFHIGTRFGDPVEHGLTVNGQEIIVTLNADQLSQLAGQGSLTVYYPMVTNKELLSSELLSTITYSVEWSNGRGGYSNDTSTSSLTFKQGILEVLVSDGDTSAAIEGAKFELFKYDEGYTLYGESLPPLAEGDYVLDDGKYYTKVNNPMTDEPYVATTGVTGEFMFQNLPFGDYKLVQLETGEGYRQNKTMVSVTIDDTEDSRYTEDGQPLEDIVTVFISNYKGKEYFPGTGTTGNLMVIASAITMMLGAVGIGFKKKRNEA